MQIEKAKPKEKKKMQMVEEEFTSEPVQTLKPKQSAMDDLDELEDFVNDYEVVGGKKKPQAQAVSNVRKP